MKTQNILLVVLLLALVAGCSSEPAPDPEVLPASTASICPSLVGSWELVSIRESSEALSGEFESDPDYQEAPTLKILNDSHWMFIRQTAEGMVHAQGGRYSLEAGGFYTEQVEYSAIPENVGEQFMFECEIVGDSVWHHVGGVNDTRYNEVWRRVN